MGWMDGWVRLFFLHGGRWGLKKRQEREREGVREEECEKEGMVRYMRAIASK